MVVIAARVRKSIWGRVSALATIALIMSACNGDGNSGNEVPDAVPVFDPDRLVLEVQPIQVCDDGGIVCAQVELFEAIADKIWDQANIEITFLPTNQLNDDTYLTIDNDNEFADLSFSGDAGDFGRNPNSTRSTGPINLWFVDVIKTSTGLVQFGNAWVGFNGVLISDDILDFNNGVGRLDVIAHELGHNLGLRHSTFGAGGDDNLLSGGSVRVVPESIDDIFPDGDRLSQLTDEQIEVARSSAFLSPVEADEFLPVLAAADAVPFSVEADAVSSSVNIPQSIPEGSPSPLTWLLWLPAAYGIRRFVGRR